jgi:lipoyl synthase
VLEILGPAVQPHRGRKPPWFKVPAPGGPRYRELQQLIRSENLNTVCQEAACPNIGECWQRGTATFMILGDTCTRRCGFCNVKTGKPTWNDPLEPARVGRSVAKMGLRHAVITSVDRDDLPDYGASAFVGVIRQIRSQAPGCKVEVLTPDFRGEEMPLAKVIAERPEVFNHNVEVVPRLYPVARRGSKFERSCRVLRNAKELGGDEVTTKSGLMVGLGETFEEMVETLAVLREHHVQVLTIGQYLRPTEQHLPIVRYWHPDEFKALETAAYKLGFEHVAAGPLVRSSYHADEHVRQDRPGTGPVAAAESPASAASVALAESPASAGSVAPAESPAPADLNIESAQVATA